MRNVYVLMMLVVTLCGCASRARIPVSDQTMASVYQDTVTQVAPRYEGPQSAPRQSAVTAAEVARLKAKFPQLPNPLLTIYVFPHLRGDLPVPGYLTAVPLYEQAPFALPGELGAERRAPAVLDTPGTDAP